MATFYGFEPADWLDDYFSVECRFRAPPNDDLLRRLGSAAGNFRPGEIGFRFSGPFAVVDVFPHPHRERGALAALADLLIDEAASELEEAVVLNSIQEPEGERPTAPGPALPGSTRALDPGLPEPVASPVFEAAMAAVLAEQKRELLREFLDSAAKQPVRLREIAPGEPPAAPAIPEILRSEQWHRSSAGTGMYRAQGTPGRIAGVSWPDGLALTGMIAVRDDRALLAARTQPRRLLQDRGPTELLLLEGKAVRHVFRLPDYDRGIVSFAWLDDDHAVVGSHKRTVVVALRGGEERATTTGGGMVTGIAGGRAIASRSGKGLRLFAWAGDRLLPLARYLHPGLELGPNVDDLPTLRVGEHRWTTDGLDDALAKALPKKPAAGKKPATRRKKKPVLVPMPHTALAADASVTPFTEAEVEAFAGANVDVRPVSPYVKQQAFRVGDVLVGICGDGIAVQRGDEPPRLIRWTSSSGYQWQLSKLRLVGERVFATDTNTVVGANIGDAEMKVEYKVFGPDIGFVKGMEAVSPDCVAVLASKGLLVLERREEALVLRDFVKISKPTHVMVSAGLGQALVGSEAKQRLVLVSLDPVKKLATFGEDAYDIRVGPEGWQVADPRRELAWRIDEMS